MDRIGEKRWKRSVPNASIIDVVINVWRSRIQTTTGIPFHQELCCQRQEEIKQSRLAGSRHG
ncbi:hypothetical protein QC763_108815 [Podospora pseudopauciseta]|uniref:Uncharacterized protein n=2 Tax=Podospora TaxID=5144 RepID=A0ABR0HYD4_9PEZI|nr:hypothetical protein QC763_108815 [Podospora pseudopauciseta]KAK4681601.1 hypothetical protein QC764_108815 [Podospora pseudoanserina]